MADYGCRGNERVESPRLGPIMDDVNTPAEPVAIDPEDRERVMLHLHGTQRLVPAIVAGFVAMMFGAVVWAVIAVFTKQEIGWIAIGIGFVVGMAVRIAGRGFDVRYAVIGGALSLAGVVLGKFLAACGFFAREEGIPIWEVLSTFPYATFPAFMRESFEIIDLLFYGLAVWCGWKYARRSLEDTEVTETLRQLKSER
jgi:hypothetical protein